MKVFVVVSERENPVMVFDSMEKANKYMQEFCSAKYQVYETQVQ